MARLVELAKVLRSKNSGPFEITFDIFLPDHDSYERVLLSGAITVENIAKVYRIPESDVQTVACMDSANGIKITILRQVSSGTAGDRDVYGAQQAAPLMELEIP